MGCVASPGGPFFVSVTTRTECSPIFQYFFGWFFLGLWLRFGGFWHPFWSYFGDFGLHFGDFGLPG